MQQLNEIKEKEAKEITCPSDTQEKYKQKTDGNDEDNVEWE